MSAVRVSRAPDHRAKVARSLGRGANNNILLFQLLSSHCGLFIEAFTLAISYDKYMYPK